MRGTIPAHARRGRGITVAWGLSARSNRESFRVTPPTPVAASANRSTVNVPVAPANRPVERTGMKPAASAALASWYAASDCLSAASCLPAPSREWVAAPPLVVSTSWADAVPPASREPVSTTAPPMAETARRPAPGRRDDVRAEVGVERLMMSSCGRGSVPTPRPLPRVLAVGRPNAYRGLTGGAGTVVMGEPGRQARDAHGWWPSRRRTTRRRRVGEATTS